MTLLTLAFLGTFRAARDGVSITDFKSDKVRALLAYLAVEASRAHRRDSLAGLLWPEWPRREALANLRYALYDLRKTIGDHGADPPYLLIDRVSLQFNATADCTLDVAEFTRWVDSSQAHQAQAAVDLYRGPFLEGLSIPDAPAFEEWTVLTRERLNQQLLAALRRLAEDHREKGDYGEACRYLRRQLEIEPWHEAGHRRLMRLLVAQGKRNAALRQYETCRQLLNEELGIAPARRTTALYEAIHAGRTAVQGESQRETPSSCRTDTPAPPKVPFVARDREISQLHRHLDRAIGENGQVTFITGEAGSGKTMLAQTFIGQAKARHPDLIAAIGYCNAHAGMGDPYLPFREILQLLAGDVAGKRATSALGADHVRRLKALAHETTEILIRSGPHLIDLFVPANALSMQALNPSPETTEVTQVALYDEVTRVLQSLATNHPLLLIFEDLQWADPGSVALLFHLGRRLQGSHIMILGTYRPSDLERNNGQERHPLAMITHEFQRDFGDIQIDLNRVEGRAFVDAIIDTEPNRLTPDFRRTLTRHTGGNPLFTVELLRELQAEGDLAQDAEGDWVCTDVAWERLPARVEAVIAERIARLPPLWQETLRIASVEGETFTAEVVARTQGLSAETMIGLLSGPLSVTHRLVVPQGLWRLEGGDAPLSRYRFRHGLFQRYLYDSLDAVTRQRHHREVGIALEALLEDEAEGIAPELARHFAAGELPERAAAYLHAAGNRAYLFAATEEAIALFMQGLALLKELPETPARRRQELQLQLALTGPLIAQRGWGAQERAGALERAHELAEQMDAAPELLKALFVLADLSRARGDLAGSLALGERMLEMAQPDATSEQMALTHYTLGETQLFRGEIATAREHLLTALSHYDAHLHQDLTSITGPNVGVICMTWLSWAVWLLGYPDEALAWAHKALSLAETLDHPLSLAFTLTVGAAGVHLLRGEPAATALYSARLAELVDEQTVAAMQPWAEVLVGVQEATGGALRAGIARVRRGIAAWAAAGALMGRSFQIMLLVELLYRAGEIEAALEEVEGMLAQIEQTGERLILPEYLRWRGVLLESKGEAPTTVEKVLRCALTTARRQSTKAWALRAAVSLARHLAEQGREDEAHALSAPIYDDFTEGFDTPDLQQARALLSGERAEIEV